MNDADPLKVALLQTLTGMFVPDVNDGDGPTSNSHLRWMRDNCVLFIDTMPSDKVSRWIGFIQGCLVCKGALDVSEERDRTRAFFHAAYEELGIEKPETMEPPHGNSS